MNSSTDCHTLYPYDGLRAPCDESGERRIVRVPPIRDPFHVAFRVAVIASVFFAVYGSLAWSQIFMGPDATNGEVGTMNTPDGVFNAIGGNVDVIGMAYDRNTDTLYASTSTQLLRINQTSGGKTVVGATAVPLHGLAYDPNTDTLYGSNKTSGQLYTVNTSTAALTAIGTPAITDVGGLGFDAITNRLYGTTPDSLVIFDTSTGIAAVIDTYIGVTDVDALTFNEADGFLYGADVTADVGIRINPLSAATITLGPLGIDIGNAGGFAGMASPSTASSTDRVLYYFRNCEDSPEHARLVLDSLGLIDVTRVTSPAAFAGALLFGSWELVLVDTMSLGVDFDGLDALVAYHDNGGRIIFASWNAIQHGQQAHEFFDRAGVTLVSDITMPEDVHIWEASPLFTFPNALMSPLDAENKCLLDGYKLEPTTAVAVAGYTPAPMTNEAAITVSANRRVIFNGTIPQLFGSSDDGDSTLDMAELYQNEILYVSDTDFLFGGDAIRSDFGWFEKDIGLFTEISPLSGGGVTGLAYNPALNVIYASDGDNLYTIVPEAGFDVFVTALSSTISGGLAYDSNTDTLYGTDNGTQLFSIDVSTGTATLIGLNALPGTVGGLAYDRINDEMFGVDDAPDPAVLIKVDTSLGTASTVGSFGGSHNTIGGLAYSEADGSLYAVDSDTGMLLEVNPDSGLATIAGDTQAVWDSTYGLTALGHPPNSLTELFEGGGDDFDLDFTSVTFVPIGTSGEYHVYRESVDDWVVDPTTHPVESGLDTSDDAAVGLSLANSFPLFRTLFPTAFLNTNGRVTFDLDDIGAAESFGGHFERVAAAILWDDLNPDEAGEVRVLELSDRAVYTFHNVTESGGANSNDFQIELFWGGTVRFTWLGVDAVDALVGLSPGGGDGLNAARNFEEFDFSSALEGIPDTDGDGIPDFWELQTGLDPFVSNAGADADSDGLLDPDEYLHGAAPDDADTDDDGALDGEEIINGSNPNIVDTDGDGVIDSEEIVLGFDPASALSTPGPATWVDFTHNGEETGDFLTPYNTLFEGLFFVPNGGTIRVLGGGSTPLTGVLDKPARIESINGTLTIGQ